MDKRIAFIICLMMIGCYSSTLNRNRRQLELDYETTTVPSENTGDEEIDFTEEISTVANFEVPEYAQNTESQNDTDLTPEDLLLESIILNFMESDDSFEDIPENLGTLQPDVSESFLTSFLSQREQLNEQIRNPGHDIENVPGKSILFDDWSDPIINAESNIQKINQKKRHISQKDEEVNDFTRRYAAKYLDEFTQNMDILKKKTESKYYTRYAENFPDELAEAMDFPEKYKEPEEIAGINIKSSSDKPIMVTDFTKNYQESQNIGKIPTVSISETPIETMDFVENPKEPYEFMKMFTDSILKTPTLPIDILEKPEQLFEERAEKVPENVHKKTREITEKYSDKVLNTSDTMDVPEKEPMEYKRKHVESIAKGPRLQTDFLEKHESLQVFKGEHDEELLNKPTKTIDISEKHKEPEEFIKMHTESISQKSDIPIDIVEKLENPQEFMAYAPKESEKPKEEMDVVVNPEESKDFTRMNTKSISERPAMPIGILENHEESEEYTRIHTKRVPEKPMEFEDLLSMYQNPSDMLRRYTGRLSNKPIELKDTFNIQEKPQKLIESFERFPKKSIDLIDTTRLLEKPRELPRVNAEIVQDKNTYAFDYPEKQKESKQYTSLYPETIANKPTWRIDILRQNENPQAFTGVYTKGFSDSPTDIIDDPIRHKNPNNFARTYSGSISDELSMPIDFLEMNEELQEFIKSHAKRVPEKLIDSMGILNKQEKQPDITGIYSETVPEKPTDDSSAHEKSQILTEMRVETVPEKNPYEKLRTHILNMQKKSKKIHSEPMTEKPTMLSDILEKHYIPQVFAGVYANKVSARPTEVINTMVKHKEPNEFHKTNTGSISDKPITPIESSENKELRKFTKIHDVREPEERIELKEVPDKSRYSINISDNQKELIDRTRVSPDSLTDFHHNPSWQIGISRMHENPEVFMKASNKEASDRLIETMDASDKYDETNAFRKTYTESIADKVTMPMDRLGNIESREFSRIYDTRVPEKTSDILSVREKPRTFAEPHAKSVPEKSTYTIDVSEKQKEFKEYARTNPETTSDMSKMHEEPMTYTGVYKVSNGPHEFTRTFIESKSDKLAMPTHSSRNEEATDFARMHAIRVPEIPFESKSYSNKQEKLREFTRIYAEKFLEKHTELSDVSNVRETPRQIAENNAKIVPDQGSHTIDILERQKELKEHTQIQPETMDAPTWRIDILRKYENPEGFPRVDNKEASDRTLSVIHKEPIEFMKTHTRSSFDESTMPKDFPRNHEESREYSRTHFIRVPEKSTELVDALSQYAEQRAPAKFNSEIVPNKRTYAIDVSEKRKEFKEDTRTYPESISNKPGIRMHILEKHEEPMRFAGVYAKEDSDRSTDIIDVLDNRKIPREFTRAYTENKSDKLTMPAPDFRNEARDFARTHAIRVPETPSEIVDFLGVREKLRTPPKINTEIDSDKITYPMDFSENRELKKLTGTYIGSPSNEARVRMAFLEKYKKPLEFEESHYKEVSTRPTQTVDASETYNKQKVFNRMYTEGISDSPTMPIDVLETYQQPTEFTKMNTNRVPEKLSESIDVSRNQGKLRDPSEIFARRAAEKPTTRLMAQDRQKIPYASTSSYTEGISRKPTGMEDGLKSQKPSKEFRGMYVEKLPYKTTDTSVYYSQLPTERTTGKTPQNKVFGTVNQENYFDDNNDRENRKDVDSSVENGPTYIGLGLRVPYIEKNNSKRQSFFRSSLRSANSTVPTTKVDTHRLTPDLLDELEPLPSLEFFGHVADDDLSDDHDDNIQQPSFLESNFKNQPSISSGLQNTTIMKVPASYTDMYRLPPDHFDKIEPISRLEPSDDEDWDNFSEENQDNVERPSFIVRAISAVVGLFMSLRRSSSEIYEIFGRLFG